MHVQVVPLSVRKERQRKQFHQEYGFALVNIHLQKTVYQYIIDGVIICYHLPKQWSPLGTE